MANPNKSIAFVGIGFEIIALLIAGVTIGGAIDRRFNLKGLGTAVMVIASLVLWFIHLIHLLKSMNQDRGPGDDGPQ